MSPADNKAADYDLLNPLPRDPYKLYSKAFQFETLVTLQLKHSSCYL